MFEQQESDVNAYKALIARIKAQPEAESILPKGGTIEDFIADINKAQEPSPVVTLEDFFEGNRSLGSIGCNLIDPPGISKFYEVLKEIRAKDNVQDVLIEISQVDEKFLDWPFSDTLYILTSASEEQVGKWLAPLQPDEIFKGWRWKKPPSSAPELEDGMRVLGVWWD